MNEPRQPSVLRELLHDARDGLLALDKNGTITFANTAAGAFLGRPPEALVGKPLAVFVPLEERRTFRRAFGNLDEAPTPVTVHLANVDEPVTILLRRIDRGSPERATATLIVGKDARIAVSRPSSSRMSRELETFFLRSPQAVVGVARDLRVAFANPQARRLLGRDIQLGRPFDDGPAEGRLRALAERLTTVAAPLPATAVSLSDGRVIRALGMPARGTDPAVLMLDDVTSETVQARVTSDFVRNAAHQLRTPLAAITSAIEILQSGAKEAPSDRDRFLEHIRHNADRLTRIARGLLVLARAQSGEPMRLDFVELRPLLDDLAAGTTPADGVAVEVDCEPGLAAFCEPDLTREAVAALVDNAVEHTREGRIRLAAAEASGRVVLEVSDTGPGILPEHQERIFEPFYRPSTHGKGFGLGLAIAAQAVEAMDGALEVAAGESGTRFTLTLPSARVVR